MDNAPDTPKPPAKPVRINLPPKGEELRSKVRDWIRWVGKNVDVSQEIPDAVEIVRQAIKDELGQALLSSLTYGPSSDDLESCFGDELAPAPADIPARAAALSCFRWRLAILETEEVAESGEPGWTEHELDDARSSALEHLGFFVRFLPVEECPQDWRYSRWEILNSYLIRDWDRALKLYNRAEERQLRSRAELQVLRGQFRVLVVFGKAIEECLSRAWGKRLPFTLDSLEWEPRIYGQDPPSNDEDFLCEVLLFSMGMADENPEPVLRDSDRELLVDSAHDLRKAVRSVPDLPPCYCALLARCCFCTDHFVEAADHYNGLLQVKLKPKFETLRQRIFASLALSYRRAGQCERAKEVLEWELREYPNAKGLYMQLAELEAQQANFPAVIECIRKEIERNPAIDADWKLSTLLALGATRDTSEALKVELKAVPDVWQPVNSILQNYWPAFGRLGVEAREEWVLGTWLAHFCRPQESIRNARWRKAAVACATAVELELKEKVFSKYRDYVLERENLRRDAERGLETDHSKMLCEFIVNNHPLALGQMTYILRECQRQRVEALQELSAWVSGKQPALMSQLGQLARVSDFRNRAVHSNLTTDIPEEIIECCRSIIESLN